MADLLRQLAEATVQSVDKMREEWARPFDMLRDYPVMMIWWSERTGKPRSEFTIDDQKRAIMAYYTTEMGNNG